MSNYLKILCNNLVLDCVTTVTCLNILMDFNMKVFNVALLRLNFLNVNTNGML